MPDDGVINNLMKSAIDARINAYSAYSNFRVGAAILCEDGTVFTGCNVENATLGLTICAERVAIVKAVSEGRRKFKAIAVSSDLKDTEVTPCGQCRQFMVEFGDFEVYLVRQDGQHHQKRTVKELLPDAFTPDTLKNEARC